VNLLMRRISVVSLPVPVEFVHRLETICSAVRRAGLRSGDKGAIAVRASVPANGNPYTLGCFRPATRCVVRANPLYVREVG